MATHDYVIDNQTSASARADINSVLQAIVTNNSSATAPTQTYGNMFWYDTANNFLKMRNEADSEWVIIGYIDQATGQFDVRTDVIQAVTAGGTVVKNSSGSTILDLKPTSQATAEAGTNNTEIMTPLRVKQSITENAPSAGWELIGSSTGTGAATINVTTTGNLYRTVKILFEFERGTSGSGKIECAETSTFRTIASWGWGSDGGKLEGVVTIHNFNNAESITLKPAEVHIVESDYDPEDTDIRSLDLFDRYSYNEAWDIVRLSSTGNGTDYNVYVFGMR